MKGFCVLLAAAFFSLSGVTGASAQASSEEGRPQAASSGSGAEIPLRRISLFSSGVGYFEHAGRTTGASPLQIILPFSAQAVNDALKSLIINDPAQASPLVRYASADSLETSLRSLAVDLSGEIEIGKILNSQKGAELEITAPSLVSGRIMGVERRVSAAGPLGGESAEQYLSLFTSQGIRTIAVKDISSFAFKDEKINADIRRALDLIMGSRDKDKKDLAVTLPGTGDRIVSLSYVIPAPAWKVSYRLDLTGDKPFLQGWAIVDNDSDTDWNNVELSLVTGKPVSFIQNLYAPYRTARPTLPLSLPGLAEGRTYESGWGGAGFSYDEAAAEPQGAYKAADGLALRRSQAAEMEEAPANRAPAPAPLAAGAPQTASGSPAGDQFEFVFSNPLSLERRQSAMLPLVEGAVKAEKTLVFSGARMSPGISVNPAISTELTNTSGMKLPAGPITVYDGGTYAGDALIAFFPENEKRLISYG
ncbi:MAG: DUF4139 domain-containing protein, partial [Treponema sp.]|nr:DUF4139 domain-containing protein [Treponema sp.]